MKKSSNIFKKPKTDKEFIEGWIEEGMLWLEYYSRNVKETERKIKILRRLLKNRERK